MTGDTPMPVVTALRARGRERVEVDLDGRFWRVVPVEAVYAVGLAIGCQVDRTTARALRRELRRLDARTLALRALRARDHTVASLEQRLAEKGTSPVVRSQTVGAAQRAGLVDDRRFALERSGLLASRGAGNQLIVADLERYGVPGEHVREAIGLLEPEADRAARIVAARGRTPRTARHLAAKGYSEDTLETLVADLAAETLD